MATPLAMTGCPCCPCPHPAIVSASASPAATPSCFFMPVRRGAAPNGFTTMITVLSRDGLRIPVRRCDGLGGAMAPWMGVPVMDSAELRALQQPLKDAYREKPEEAV